MQYKIPKGILINKLRENVSTIKKKAETLNLRNCGPNVACTKREALKNITDSSITNNIAKKK